VLQLLCVGGLELDGTMAEKDEHEGKLALFLKDVENAPTVRRFVAGMADDVT
jgi:hypothetical protein